MEHLLELQKKIVPDLLRTLEERYDLLREIAANGSIGRRALSERLHLTERRVRTEVDYLRNNGLLQVDPSGMRLTEEGIRIVQGLRDSLAEIRGIHKLEDSLRQRLGIKKTVIAENLKQIPLSGEESLREMGTLASQYFRSQLFRPRTIGITGGTTMYSFAQMLPQEKNSGDHRVVPARGGLGEEMEIQSNNVAALVSGKINAPYKLLHVPDNVDKDIIESIRGIPQVRETLDLIEQIDMLVFGIGNAMDMAERRKNPKAVCQKILKSGAVSEAFGYYFNIRGEIVYETTTVGITLAAYEKMEDIIGIAGGESKAKAILSISKINKNLVLITDESAARVLMELTGGFDNKNIND